MSKYSEIGIITLEKRRVASYCFQYSESPETPAVEKIKAFTKARNLLESKPQFYGFNNPDPYRSPKKPEYGYESWVTVGENVRGDDKIEIKETESGEYLAMYGVHMDDAWKWMMNKTESNNYDQWRNDNGYEYDTSRQWLDWTIHDESKYPEMVEKEIILLFPMKKVEAQ